MKKLKHIISWTIWSLLALYVVVLVLVHLPFVQSFLGEKTASILGDKLGTRVSVGRVDLGFLNRIIIDDVIVYDQADSVMLQAGRLSVKVDMLPLLEGRVAISSAQLFGACADLYKTDSLSAPNYQFAIDSLASSDTTNTGSIDLRVNSLIIRHSSIRYNRRDIQETPELFNANHLYFHDISAHVKLKVLNEDSLNLDVKRLAFKEQSGLSVDRFSMQLAANRQNALLEDFRLQLPHSTLCIGNLSASYDADRFDETVRYSTSLDGTCITPSDLSCLVPGLRDFTHALTINATIDGTAKGMKCRTMDLVSDDAKVNLQGAFSTNWQDSLPTWKAHIKALDLRGGIIADLKEAFDAIPIETTRLGNLHLSGDASGRGLSEVDASSIIVTEAGRLGLSFNLADGRQFKGRLSLDSIHLGKIFDNQELGRTGTRSPRQIVVRPRVRLRRVRAGHRGQIDRVLIYVVGNRHFLEQFLVENDLFHGQNLVRFVHCPVNG